MFNMPAQDGCLRSVYLPRVGGCLCSAHLHEAPAANHICSCTSPRCKGRQEEHQPGRQASGHPETPSVLQEQEREGKEREGTEVRTEVAGEKGRRGGRAFQG